MSALLKTYQRFLARHPYLCQSLQTGLLMGAGDVLAQTYVGGAKAGEVNWRRTGEFSAIGAFMVGPALTKWYQVLAKRIGNQGSSAALKKVAVDQLAFAPTFLAIFVCTLGAVQGKGREAVLEELRKNYKDLILTNYKIWPAAQLFNFYFVPLNYQVLFVQSIAIFWNTYLSWKTHDDK